MQKEQIFVFGPGNVAPAVLEHSKQHTIITAGLQKHNNIASYICVNDAGQLDALMSNRPTASLLAARNIYAKYAFFKGVECMPHFEDLATYKWDSHLVSQQLLAVALAAWMGANVVIMAGLQIDNKKEQDNLRALITLYGDIEFLHVSKENKNFDDVKLKNFTAMDQPQFKQRMRSHA
jgi:hypothetical protein